MHAPSRISTVAAVETGDHLRSAGRDPRRAIVAVLAALAGACEEQTGPAAASPVSTLPDLSGLVWLSGDRFLAVHDAKNDAAGERIELGRPRLSFVSAATTPEGVLSQALPVQWPAPLGPSHDLESAARIPGTQRVLLLESGDDGSDFQRVFLAEVVGDDVRLSEAAPWPVPVHNVEGSAVALVGGQLVFVYAERNQGSTATELRWAPMQLDPLRFGAFKSARVEVPGELGINRPVVAMEIDAEGGVVVASAFDPDDDDGPFLGAILRVGAFVAGAGGVDFVPAAAPEVLATANGVKIESVAIRETESGEAELFYGTDDENYGAILRRVLLR